MGWVPECVWPPGLNNRTSAPHKCISVSGLIASTRMEGALKSQTGHHRKVRNIFSLKVNHSGSSVDENVKIIVPS